MRTKLESHTARRLQKAVRMVVGAAVLSAVALIPPACTVDEAIWPTTGLVTSMYGTRCPRNAVHKGIDIASFGRVANVDVVATQAGTVIAAGWQRGYGNRIIVEHANGWSSLYAHLNSFVRRSGWVQQGEHIGEMGATGNATGNHLHFEMRRDGVPQNFNGATWCGATIRTGAPIETPFAGIRPGG